MKTPLTWGRALKRFADYVVGRGVDASALLRAAKVDPRVLADVDARVPITAFYAVVEHSVAALGDPFLGLHYIDEAGFASSDAVGFLAMSSRTVGEAMRRFALHHERLSEGEDFKLSVVRDRAVITCECFGPERLGKAQQVEMYAAGCLLLAARYTGSPLDVLSLRFRHPAPKGDLRIYQRLLGRIPEFGADANVWSFPKSILERPMMSAEDALVGFFEEHLRERLAVRQTPHYLLVRKALASMLPDGNVTLSAVAERLALSPRTLQRRLTEESHTFDAILTDVRRSQAATYLSVGLPIAEVSYLLGYSDPVAFHRAFKRMTGTTPQGWRRAHPSA